MREITQEGIAKFLFVQYYLFEPIVSWVCLPKHTNRSQNNRHRLNHLFFVNTSTASMKSLSILITSFLWLSDAMPECPSSTITCSEPGSVCGIGSVTNPCTNEQQPIEECTCTEDGNDLKLKCLRVPPPPETCGCPAQNPAYEDSRSCSNHKNLFCPYEFIEDCDGSPMSLVQCNCGQYSGDDWNWECRIFARLPCSDSPSTSPVAEKSENGQDTRACSEYKKKRRGCKKDGKCVWKRKQKQCVSCSALGERGCNRRKNKSICKWNTGTGECEDSNPDEWSSSHGGYFTKWDSIKLHFSINFRFYTV